MKNRKNKTGAKTLPGLSLAILALLASGVAQAEESKVEAQEATTTAVLKIVKDSSGNLLAHWVRLKIDQNLLANDANLDREEEAREQKFIALGDTAATPLYNCIAEALSQKQAYPPSSFDGAGFANGLAERIEQHSAAYVVIRNWINGNILVDPTLRAGNIIVTECAVSKN
jgi:hypothetical protein